MQRNDQKMYALNDFKQHIIVLYTLYTSWLYLVWTSLAVDSILTKFSTGTRILQKGIKLIRWGLAHPVYFEAKLNVYSKEFQCRESWRVHIIYMYYLLLRVKNQLTEQLVRSFDFPRRPWLILRGTYPWCLMPVVSVAIVWSIVAAATDYVCTQPCPPVHTTTHPFTFIAYLVYLYTIHSKCLVYTHAYHNMHDIACGQCCTHSLVARVQGSHA